MALKIIVDDSDTLNANLISELAEKNELVRKQSEEKIKHSEDRYRSLFEQASDAIVISDLKGNFTDCNPKLCQLLGYTREEIIGRNITEFLDKAQLEQDPIRLDLLAQGELRFNERKMLRKDGSIVEIENSVKKMSDDRLLGILRDVSQRKKIERELREAEAPFRTYIRNAFGVNVEEGQSITQIYRNGVRLEEFSTNWSVHYRRAMEGESFTLEHEYYDRHFKFSFNPIVENEMVAGVNVFSEETTELRKREKELFEANRQIDDLKLMALLAAMNPHFIFNTLNSIQYYIMENDQRNAVNYLSTFSRLIRSILNHSVVSKVKLNEELEMLRHYVLLEQMRFENKFDFMFDVDPAVDTENIEIPSMLIQPYVENAILHGINNKPGRGTLKISVKQSSDSILFEVEDDGVGRQATHKLQEQKLNDHKSYGTTLTEERLKLINTRRKVSFEIIDLEKKGLPAGTRVKIWIGK